MLRIDELEIQSEKNREEIRRVIDPFASDEPQKKSRERSSKVSLMLSIIAVTLALSSCTLFIYQVVPRTQMLNSLSGIEKSLFILVDFADEIINKNEENKDYSKDVVINSKLDSLKLEVQIMVTKIDELGSEIEEVNQNNIHAFYEIKEMLSEKIIRKEKTPKPQIINQIKQETEGVPYDTTNLQEKNKIPQESDNK